MQFVSQKGEEELERLLKTNQENHDRYIRILTKMRILLKDILKGEKVEGRIVSKDPFRAAFGELVRTMNSYRNTFEFAVACANPRTSPEIEKKVGKVYNLLVEQQKIFIEFQKVDSMASDRLRQGSFLSDELEKLNKATELTYEQQHDDLYKVHMWDEKIKWAKFYEEVAQKTLQKLYADTALLRDIMAKSEAVLSTFGQLKRYLDDVSRNFFEFIRYTYPRKARWRDPQELRLMLSNIGRYAGERNASIEKLKTLGARLDDYDRMRSQLLTDIYNLIDETRKLFKDINWGIGETEYQQYLAKKTMRKFANEFR